MLRCRKIICIFLMALLLSQPVFAETEAPTQPTEPDIITAVYSAENLPDTAPLDAPQWLRELIAAPLYTMDEGGNWVPVLAASLPEDVTADFAGTYGIPETAQRGFAFRIAISPDARWEDGRAITADDCILSIQKMLEADETADNWLFLAHADAIRSGKLKPGSEITSLRDLGYPGVSEAWGAGYREFFVDTDGFWGLSGGWMSVSDRTRLQDFAMPGGLDEGFVSPAYLYTNYLMDGMESSYYQSEFVGTCRTPGMPYTMDDLGLVKESEQKFVVIMQNSATASMVMNCLEAFVLTDERSYGPYRVTSVTESEIILEPNPHWWGEEDNSGYDRILCRKIGT